MTGRRARPTYEDLLFRITEMETRAEAAEARAEALQARVEELESCIRDVDELIDKDVDAMLEAVRQGSVKAAPARLTLRAGLREFILRAPDDPSVMFTHYKPDGTISHKSPEPQHHPTTTPKMTQVEDFD